MSRSDQEEADTVIKNLRNTLKTIANQSNLKNDADYDSDESDD